MTFTGKCRNQETSHLEDDQFFCFCFCVLFCFVLCFLFRSGLIVMGDLSKWKNTKKGSHCDEWPTQLKKKRKMRARRRTQKNGRGLEGVLERKQGLKDTLEKKRELKGTRRGSEGSKALSKKESEGSKARSKGSEGSKALEEEARAQRRARKKKARAQRRARREVRANT